MRCEPLCPLHANLGVHLLEWHCSLPRKATALHHVSSSTFLCTSPSALATASHTSIVAAATSTRDQEGAPFCACLRRDCRERCEPMRLFSRAHPPPPLRQPKLVPRSLPMRVSAAAAVVTAHVGMRALHTATGIAGSNCDTPLHATNTSAHLAVSPQRHSGIVLPSFMRSGTSSTAFTAPAHSGRCCGCAAAAEQHRLCSSHGCFSHSDGSFAGGSRPYVPGQAVQEKYPIIQLPARSLWCRQYALDPCRVAQGEYAGLISQVREARHYYQYPSLSAPQTGWNVQMFTLFDDTVFINPVNLDEEAWRSEAAQRGMSWVAFEEEKMRELRAEGLTGFAWEPCASSGFLLHYIERPLTVRVRALNEHGTPFTVTLDQMRARMALHELDHVHGILFTRRVVDTDHVVPMEGFVTMSDWSDDYPSLEARSTFLYTIFTPPYHFVSDSISDGNLLDRRFEDGIYPGCEYDRQQRIELTAMEAVQRNAWRKEKAKQEESGQKSCYGDVAAAVDNDGSDAR
ncbi:metalloprotease-like protein [Leishmania tarentolae]|uniref:Peptide deformylase n=1 Tax=Leishmania tarentolae TaxID=5689 RepID=A0A640K8R6_LEITA|nr:metalloprotease-like protein [Leishmania tarentolae]